MSKRDKSLLRRKDLPKVYHQIIGQVWEPLRGLAKGGQLVGLTKEQRPWKGFPVKEGYSKERPLGFPLRMEGQELFGGS